MNQPTPATDPMPPWPGIILDAERAHDQADTDTGLYYAIAKRSGTLVTRGGRPLMATLTEWLDYSVGFPSTAYIPVGAHPLFGSLPLHDTGKVPDLVGRLVNAVAFLESGATMLVTRVQHIDKAIAAHLPDSTEQAAQQREKRAEAEARPHDEKPKMTLGEALRHPLDHPQPGNPVPDAEQPPGEAAYLLEGDDEIFTAPTPVIVHVVAEDDGNVLHVASTAGKAEQWLMSTAGNREARDALSITELAVDRG